MRTKIIMVLIADVLIRILSDKLNITCNDNFFVDIYLKNLHDVAKKCGSLVAACKSININYYKLLDMLKL